MIKKNLKIKLSTLSYKGWYRECGIIPHTTDIDLNLFAREYNSYISKYFQGHKDMPLVMSLGEVSHMIR